MVVDDTDPMKWPMVSRAAKAEPAVFIVGVPRSGTTVLYKTLQTLPEFALNAEVGEADLTETHIFSGLLVGRLAWMPVTEQNARAFSYYLRDEEAWQAFCDCVGRLRVWQQTWLKILSRFGQTKRLQRSSEYGGIFWRFLSDPHVLRCYFFYARRARRTIRILEKTPAHVLHMPKIWASFPKAKVIAGVRHPVDVFASLRKRLKREVAAGRSRAEVIWLSQTPAEFCNMYRSMVAILEPYWSRPQSNVYVVKYEDLTADKETQLANIFHFVGARHPEDYTGDIYLKLSGHRKHSAEKVPLLFEPIQARSSQWRDYISSEEAAHIERSLRSEMAWLEYDPVSS